MAGMELETIEDSSETYREVGIDVGGLDETDGKKGKKKKTSQQPKTVTDGLQLSLKGHKHAFVSYTYTLSPLMDHPVRVDWKRLTADGVECQHIRYHHLQTGDNLPSLVLKYKKSHAVAVILVNTEDSRQLRPEFCCEEAVRSKTKKGALPMIVISSEDGRKLKEFLNRHDPGELHARIESKNMPHVEPPVQQGGATVEASYSPSLKKRGGKLTQSFRLKSRRMSINLKEELKQLLFPLSGPPACISENERVFKDIMLIFYQYEQAFQREGHHTDGAVFRKLTKHMDEMFSKDFPFYLIIAYRVHQKHHMYHCDELSPFVKSCIDRFEALEQGTIAKTLETFLKMDNFKIMFDQINANLTVLHLLEDACIALMKQSFVLKSQDGSQLGHRSVYHRMLWISLAYKCHVERATGSRKRVDYWKDYLTANQTLVHLNMDTIQSVKRGVEFGRLLGLPNEASFTSVQMADILTAGGSVRPFNQMREFVIVLEPYVAQESEFVRNLLAKPRECYHPFFKNCTEESMKLMHPEGNLLAILQDGLSFLDTILDVVRTHHWTGTALDKEMKDWLSMLLLPVDITTDRAESYLKDFLTAKTQGVTKHYYEHIKREVIIKLQDKFSSLSVERFLKVYKAFLIWPTWVVEKYLKQYKIPKGVKICDVIWNDFLSEFVDRFPDAQHHKFLLEFLKSVAKCYLEQERAKDFILDLLHLNIPNLFVMESEGSTSALQDILATTVPDDFMNFLSDYIQRNYLQETILNEVNTIWELVAEHSEFQQLILQVLQHELIPESLALKGTLKPSLQSLLDNCVTAICESLHSGLNNDQELTSRLNFCWGVVSSCCAKMPILANLEWVKSYYAVIDQLGRIYGVYCEAQKLEDTKSVLDEESMPKDITECSSTDIKMFFSWISKAQQVMDGWRVKFHSRSVNYDEILHYAKNFSQISRVASALYAETLVVDMQYVQGLKQKFLQHFELLNIFLLCYIPGQPEAVWCALHHMLSKYGVGFPPSILLTVKQLVTLPGETKRSGQKSAVLENPIPPSVSKTFNPNQDIHLEISSEMSLAKLESLVQSIAAFCAPIEDNLKVLAFFFLHESDIFDKYLKLQLNKLEEEEKPAPKVSPTPAFSLPQVVSEQRTPTTSTSGVSIVTLGKALAYAKELVLKLVGGSASYNDITANGLLNLRTLDIDREFEVLDHYADFAKIDRGSAEGLRGVKALMQLFQYTRHIQVIQSVCEQYQLDGCLEDPDLQELMMLVNILDQEQNRDKLTTKEAIDKMDKVTKVLRLEKDQNPRFLDLFAAVADSADFHQFIVREKKFVGESGQALFQQQYQLLTTHLQHEEYNEVVLNHLFAAFKLITPFTEKNQNFSQLMSKVSMLNAYDGRRQLETVNRSINLIRLWFSKAEGDTLQGVAAELNCVLDSGYYKFMFNTTTDAISASAELHYIPHSTRYQNVGEVKEQATAPTEYKWNADQISDFVRKLGFLDAEGTAASQIKTFLHLNQTAKKLLGLYSKLRELGHPDYLQRMVPHELGCSVTQDEADEMVMYASTTLSKWELEMANLRSEYEQLLFFSVPKLLHLYQNLTAEQPNPILIVHDVGFLFQNKPDVQLKLKKTVKTLLEKKPYLEQSTHHGNTPMHVVGAFLSELFFDLSSHSLKRRRTGSHVASMSSQSTHILHSCHGFSQSQLIRLIISIFGGVPESFEVFHCRSTTTEEEIRLFLNPKRATKRPFQFLMLEINKLSYQLQETLLRVHFELKQKHSSADEIACVHLLETAPSLLQEMPWLLHRDYTGIEPSLGFEQAVMTCQKSALNPDDFDCIQLVYGHAGDGKTHYIESQLKQRTQHLKVAINEAFTPLTVIKKLCMLPTDKSNCAVFFNFTMLPPGESVDDQERKLYSQLVEVIGWFFFDLFILGYVEDPVTGFSFQFPGGMQWAVYIEVPSRVQMTPEMSLKEFFEDIPALGLLGTPHVVYRQAPYVVDSDVQLVCKYLKAYRTGGTKGIDKLYKEGGGGPFQSRKPGVPVKFSLEPDLSESDCHKLLKHYTPQHMKKNKATQKLFVKYMKRRCAFLDNCPAFNYNNGASEYITSEEGGQKRKNDTTRLGSTLMYTMLEEVSDFCDPIIRENWSLKPHHQLIYDFKDGGGTFGLMSLHPDEIAPEDKEKFKKIGVQIPNMMELYSRDLLDSYLSRALGVPLDSKNRLSPVDDSAYVLTLDFAIKMLNIHERAECGVPVIIEGETGVGKTALMEMLSKLWNYSLFRNWGIYKERVLDYIRSQLEKLPPSVLEKNPGCIDSVKAIASSGNMREDDLITIGELPLEKGQFYSVIRDHILELVGDPELSMLELREEDRDEKVSTVPKLVGSAKYKDNPKDTARLLFKFLNSKIKGMFYKLNVHAALLPSQIIKFFEPIFEQAEELDKAYERFKHHIRIPFITVFLDEVNTSSCLGLFKEIIIDRTLDGRPLPTNIFIIGACNPHRGNSLAAIGTQDTWIRGTYYVRQLHPTLQCLMWDYGALGESQERDYILAKMKIFNKDGTNADLAMFTDLIVRSQNLMRSYAYEQLNSKECGLTEAEASEYSRSCVSQRDIQRVFTFYEWLMKMYRKYKPYGARCDYNSRAVIVSLGLVYYLRLDSKHRTKYRETLDHAAALSRVSFSKCFEDELNWYIDHIDLPPGIAKTNALKENLFATIVCTMTHTPLIIVGSPGSSKTLSFNLTLANLKGQESKVAEFRKTDIFKSLDPQVYQCSRRTTSNEISTVFNRAINRQRSHQKVPLPVYCVVFMDEAGLPQERHESLKVLHYFLDTQEVSFVAISNHVLDAAKTNRAVSLFRPDASQEDLVTLAKGCLCEIPDNPPPELRKDMDIVASFCPAYEALMRKEHLKRFFGLRDFIHFISYLRRNRMEMLSPQLVMKALERNFNGVSKEDFQYICKVFLRAVHSSPDKVHARNILDILCSSLIDHPTATGAENEMRYKLIIDSSEDGSLVRLLFSTGVLDRRNTKVYMCSDFPGDSELQKVNTIAAVRHSATEGHTVVLSQTDAIHESFYDLFNRRFHRIDDATNGPRYYSNISIGAHIKPCRVHLDFECMVIVKQSELEYIPPPFLNRFEKYLLSHELVLEATLSNLPPALTVVLKTAAEKAKEFLECVGGTSSIYGLQPDTVSSLLITLLPPIENDYKPRYQMPNIETSSSEVKMRILEMLLQALKENAGFQIPVCSLEEMELDAEEVFALVQRDSEFAGQILRMTTEYNSTETLYMSVTEALRILYQTKSIKVVSKEISVNACLVVSVLTHWLVRHLCKRLMQLMTSEALCMHHRKVPASYIQTYLNHQQHFSLKCLLEPQHALIKEKCNANKLVCYTRSSQLLHHLPAQYPSAIPQASSLTDTDAFLSDLVLTQHNQLVVHKLSAVTSYTYVNDLLKSFATSKTQNTLLMVINMQETSKEVVNHLRIMIEETENRLEGSRKLYVLLLHFPSSKLTSPCYPSLFLQGWDFHYLDVIGYGPQAGVIDIRDWFRQCYNSSPSPDSSIATQLNSLLREAIPVISSRVFFGSHATSSFNKPMSLPERNSILEELFFAKGVGDVLCERFNSYWHPSVMVEYLEKAAILSQQHERTLNVIDSLQTLFKNLFFDFLVHMVYKMNEGMNIDVIFNPDAIPGVQTLFLAVLRIYPIPKLCELKMLSIASDASAGDIMNQAFLAPKFPFFHLVASAVEKLVDQSRMEVNQHVDMLSDRTEPPVTLFQSSEQGKVKTMAEMLKNVETKLKELSEGVEKTTVSLAVQVMKKTDFLWQKYLEDFTHQKLRLEFGSTGISQKVLRAAFGNLDERSVVQRLAVLHVYVNIHKLNLAKVVSILRPLEQIEKAKAVLPSLSSRISSPSQSLLEEVEDSDNLFGHPEALSVFVINTLFNAIAAIGMSCANTTDPQLEEREAGQVKQWYMAYRDVMSMPAMNEQIYRCSSMPAEAKHSVMHALFLLIRSNPTYHTDDLQHGLKTFNRLYLQYFKPTMELVGENPRLRNIANVVQTELTSASNPRIRHVLEGLFAHFFSSHRSGYHSEDILFFLEMANLQTQWQATFLMNEVIEVGFSEDLLSKLDFDPNSPEVFVERNPLKKMGSYIPMSVFKLYLHRILLSPTKASEDPVHSVMLCFQETHVHSLISKVLSADESLGPAGPYIPTFYQFSEAIEPCPAADNQLMQQPLAHLYFLTIFDDLLNSKFDLSSLIKTTQSIAKCEHYFEGHSCPCCNQECRSDVAEDQLQLLHIEEQAIVQVIIKEVASHLDMKDSSKINTIYSVLEDLNAILDDQWMGGGTAGGHGLVLIMHLLKEQQSFSKFVHLLTDQYTLLCDGINCLKPFHKALCNAPLPSNATTFMPYEDMGAEFQSIYTRVTAAMNAVHTTHGAQQKVKELVRIADECSNGTLNVTIPSGRTAMMKKMDCFRMSVWLTIVNEFYLKKKNSSALAGVVGTSLAKKLGPCTQLFQCFLDSECMLKNCPPDSSRQDQLYNIFHSTSGEDTDLCMAIIHMITIALGCQPQSTHLWYHLFNVEELTDSYMTGFMYDSPVGPKTVFYDAGVELTPEGMYGHHDYIQHATRGTLSLHSLCLLLWTNFAGFSVAQLTQTNAVQKLSGKIISESEPVREYCVSQMIKMWRLLCTGLSVSEEERLLLVGGCLNQLFEQQLLSHSRLTGKLYNRLELDRYEKVWHTQIFLPRWESLKQDFAKSSALLKMPVLKDIMHLDARYPWFPDVKTLTQNVLSSADLTDPAQDLYPLSRFVLEYPRLRMGVNLLARVVDLYQWLHTELVYAVSYDDATSITLGRLAKVVSKHSLSDRKVYYEKLKDDFNEYVHLTGCTKHKRPMSLSDDTPVLHLLSHSVDGKQGSDLLYCVIADIINFINQFLQTLLKTIERTPISEKYFPRSVPKVHVMELAQHYMLVGKTKRAIDLLQLIHGNSYLPLPTPSRSSATDRSSNLPAQLGALINLDHLQEDVLGYCIAGMPLIEESSISSLRVPFKFKEEEGAMSSLESLEEHAVDLKAIEKSLPYLFKASIPEDYRKRLEYEFHSADYHTIMAVITGLRTAIGHLIKEVTVDSSGAGAGTPTNDLLNQTLPQFLNTLYEYDQQEESKDVFHEIGIHNLTQTQHACLGDLQLAILFKILRLFVQWAEEGMYDFCSLPYAAKMPLTLPDEDTMRQIPDNYDGSARDLLKELKSFLDVLVYLEPSIMKALTEKPQRSITKYLKDLQVCNKEDKLVSMIPDGILLENYVPVRLILRKLINEVQVKVSQTEFTSPEPSDDKWSDFVEDLWEVRLPHFRHRGYVFSSAQSSPLLGSDGEHSSKILNELIHYSSETNLLEIIEDEIPVFDDPSPPSSPPLPKQDTPTENQRLNEEFEKLAHDVNGKDVQQLAKQYTVGDLVSFLQSIHLDQYATAFEDYDINGELLMEFSDDDLKDIGVTSALHRLKISTLFRRLVTRSQEIADRYPVECVVKFLNDHRQLKQFAPSFEQNNIDGELLLKASDDVMRELGVERGVHIRMIVTKFKALVQHD